MRKDSPYAILTGMILTLMVWLLVMEVVWPASVSLYFFPISVFVVILWLNAWRVSKKQKTAIEQPRLEASPQRGSSDA